jgi:predicted aspartyl protease
VAAKTCSSIAAIILSALGAMSVAAPPLAERTQFASRVQQTAPVHAVDDADFPDNPRYAVATRRDRIGRIIAEVSINQQGPFRFMLDTGASRTAVATSTLRRLGLAADPELQMMVVGISGSAAVSTVHIHSLDAGDLHFRDLDLPVLAGPVLDGLDGILGMADFTGMRISADFAKDRFSISQSNGRRASYGYSVIPVQIVSEHLLMAKAMVGGIHVKAIIDTGTSLTLGNPALLAALAHAHFDDSSEFETSVTDATETQHRGDITRVPEVQLGLSTIDNLSVAFGDFSVFKAWGLENEPALLIGMDVLGTLDELTVDYRRSELQILPHKRWDNTVVSLRW